MNTVEYSMKPSYPNYSKAMLVLQENGFNEPVLAALEDLFKSKNTSEGNQGLTSKDLDLAIAKIDLKISSVQKEIVESRLGTERQIAELKGSTERQIAELKGSTERQIAELKESTTLQISNVQKEIVESRLATERQIAELKQNTTLQILNVQKEIQQVKADLEKDIQQVKADLQKDIQQVKADLELKIANVEIKLQKALNMQIWKIVGLLTLLSPIYALLTGLIRKSIF